MRVLTEDQCLFADYLTAAGMPLIERMLVVTELWEPEATQEMFQRISETEEKRPDQLSKLASEIARKYSRNRKSQLRKQHGSKQEANIPRKGKQNISKTQAK